MFDLKDAATVLSLLIAALALWRNVKGDQKGEGAQIQAILTKMELMQSDLKEIKADFKAELKGLKTDFDQMKERLVKVEQKASSAHKRIDELHEEHFSEEN